MGGALTSIKDPKQASVCLHRLLIYTCSSQSQDKCELTEESPAAVGHTLYPLHIDTNFTVKDGANSRDLRDNISQDTGALAGFTVKGGANP